MSDSNLTSLIQNISKMDLKIGFSCKVRVTHIEGPHSFFVRPITYTKFLPELHKHKGLMKSSDLHLHKLVIYYSDIFNTFIRGNVTYIDDEKAVYDLHGLDFGVLEKSVPLNKIYKPSHDIEIPSLAIHCQLANCKPLESDTFDKKICDAMKYFVGNEVSKINVTDIAKDKLIVELFNSCPEDIATMLAYGGYTTFGFGASCLNVLPSTQNLNTNFKYKQLKVGDVLQVRVQSGETLKSFYVAEVTDYKQYLQVRNELTHYARSQKPLEIDELRLEQPVSVINDCMKYERAIIKKIPQNDNEKVLVQLLDWGLFKETYVSKLRKLSEIYLMNPAVAIYCSADESQTWDNKLHKFLYPGFEFKITIKKTGCKFVQQNLVDIAPIQKYY